MVGLRGIYQKLKFYYRINWTKTLYFNFKKFPFNTAKKLPVYFYGKVKFQSIRGNVIIEGTIKRGMIGFGQQYESSSCSKGTAEIFIEGVIKFKGYIQFGKDYFVYVASKGYLEMGHMSSLGSNGKIICYNSIVLGNFARIGFESQLMDSNFHQMIDTVTGEHFPITNPINIGSYNYIGNRVSIMPKTKTPNYCSIASNSLCNDDFSKYGENVLIGGLPARMLKINITRDWKHEVPILEQVLKIG